MCDLGDDGPSASWESAPVARKEHKCCECQSVIRIGERYELAEGVWDGKFARYRTCSICSNVRGKAIKALRKGIAYECLWETVGVDFEEAAAV